MSFNISPAPIRRDRSAGAAPRRPLPAAVTALALLLVVTAGCGGERKTATPPAAPAGSAASAGPARSAGSAARAAAREETARSDTLGGREAAAAQILIKYRGCLGAGPGVTRTRDEAEDLARRLAFLATEPGGDFAELARRWSDDPAAARTGGYLGVVAHGDLDIGFETILFGLRPGEVGDVLETDNGWHVIKRLPVRRVHAHHILIAWRGAELATSAVTRTQAQAQALAAEVRLQAVAPRADLCRLARRFSDDAGNATECGDLGVLSPGSLPPPLDEALFRLRPGQVSDVLESPYGFHILWREP
ncbi:MAG: peptidylprolyl isomerase [Candidatus Krumholzibacteriia bacterium]